MANPLSMLVALADAVKAALNAAQVAPSPVGTWQNPFATPFTAERRFVAVRDPSKLPFFNADPPQAPRVVVVPMADGESRLGGGMRAITQGEFEVDVTIYSRVGPGEEGEAACGTLMDLRQQIRDFFKVAPQGGGLTVIGSSTARAVLTAIGGEMAFDEGPLYDGGLFVSPQTLKFNI